MSPLLTTLLACAEPSGTPPHDGTTSTRPDVFVFSIDTLRADHLEAYGYHRATAPWIASVAKEGVVFDAASATSSWTVPSVASLLTGMLPHQLGVERAPSIAGPDDPRPKLPATATTLAERLKAEGYRTYAVTANTQLADELGYGQGFDRYVNVGFAPADVVQQAADALAEEIRGGRGPVFVWIHLVDPHDPYGPSGSRNKVEAWSPGFSDYAVESGLPALPTLTMGTLKERSDLRRHGPAVQHLQALYDAEISQSDAVLGHIYGSLGVGDDDVLVVTADHGEEFLDHGNLGHRVTLFEETVRVPLIARWKGHWPARRVPERVSLASLAPTFSALAGGRVPDDAGLAASSILPLLEGQQHWTPAEPVIAQLVHVDNKMIWRAIYDGDDKLVTNDDGDGAKVDRTRLYELQHDPAELMNAAAVEPGRVEELTEVMDGFLGALPVLEPEWLTGGASPETIEQLRAMGYIE